jgi:sn-glycerol 3-phosphate transport system substrate-binding protein
MKRILIALLFLFITTTLFAKKQTITFWHILGYHAKPVLDGMVDEYNRTNPGVQVKPDFQGFFEDAQVKMLTAAVSKSLPDLAQVPFEFLQVYVQNGLIEPMNEEIPDELKRDVQDKMWQLVSRDGDLYGVPFCVFTDVFYYNGDAFEKAGLDPESPPDTWDEMIEIGKRLTSDTDGDGILDNYALTFYTKGMYGLAPVLWANGGSFFTGDGRIDLTSPEMKKTMAMVHDLFFRHQIMSRTWTDWENAQAFLTGHLAMGWFISAGIPYGEQNLPWTLRIAHMPRINGNRHALLSGTALVNFARKKKQRRAVNDFMSWLVGRENDIQFYEKIGFVPLRKSSLNSLQLKAFAKANPNYRIPLEALEYAQPLPNHPEFFKINQEISDMLERIILNNGNPDEELKKTELLINQTL